MSMTHGALSHILAPSGRAGYSPSMSGTNDRSERLATALRANLSRRKAQARARRAGEAAPESTARLADKSESASAASPSGKVEDTGALDQPTDGQDQGPAAETPQSDANSGENPARGGSTALAARAAKIVPDGEPG
ncbi:hypothetical protein [Xanthobacter autotrophicus]|uniref:hypothetical protein n=1 Tax=Xanthobacter autotrophicus TaxID=280 RepID=UPI00372BC056